MVTWLHPAACDPPHRAVRHDQVARLTAAFTAEGWGKDEPALVGYPLDGRIQLLSGSHRHAAALLADILIPVALKPYEAITNAWGTRAWEAIMDAPVVTR